MIYKFVAGSNLQYGDKWLCSVSRTSRRTNKWSLCLPKLFLRWTDTLYLKVRCPNHQKLCHKPQRLHGIRHSCPPYKYTQIPSSLGLTTSRHEGTWTFIHFKFLSTVFVVCVYWASSAHRKIRRGLRTFPQILALRVSYRLGLRWFWWFSGLTHRRIVGEDITCGDVCLRLAYAVVKFWLLRRLEFAHVPIQLFAYCMHVEVNKIAPRLRWDLNEAHLGRYSGFDEYWRS